MKRSKNNYTAFNVAASILMILALLWLTISTPFVYSNQQSESLQLQQHTDEDNLNNSLTNTTEEKNESGSSASEYLHDEKKTNHILVTEDLEHKFSSVDLFMKFKPDLVLPPPKSIVG